MKSFEENTHSFIVRIWLEPRELKGASPEWRGEIEHVANGKRRGLKDLDEIIPFIAHFLEEIGAKLSGHHKSRKRSKWKLDFLRRN